MGHTTASQCAAGILFGSGLQSNKMRSLLMNMFAIMQRHVFCWLLSYKTVVLQRHACIQCTCVQWLRNHMIVLIMSKLNEERKMDWQPPVADSHSARAVFSAPSAGFTHLHIWSHEDFDAIAAESTVLQLRLHVHWSLALVMARFYFPTTACTCAARELGSYCSNRHTGWQGKTILTAGWIERVSGCSGCQVEFVHLFRKRHKQQFNQFLQQEETYFLIHVTGDVRLMGTPGDLTISSISPSLRQVSMWNQVR